MTPTDGGKSPPSEFAGRIERLRKAGFSEDEIEEFLKPKTPPQATQPRQPATSFASGPQMPMTGVLGNASAVLSHAQNTFPVIKENFANLAAGSTSRTSRAKSAAILVGVAAIVGLLGFAIYQEWQIHIVYAPEIQRLTTEITRYETDIKRLTVDLTTAQNQKAQAEAKVAPSVTAGEKAKADAASFIMNPHAFGDAVQEGEALKAQLGQDVPVDSEEKRTCVLMNGQRICSRPDK